MADTKVSIDVRNLFSARVVKFDVKAGPPQHVEVSFDVQADKTRAIEKVNVAYGKFPSVETYPGSGEYMTATDINGDLKEYDVIKQNAWNAVMQTTEANQASGTGTHADVSWPTLVSWVEQETAKPSLSQTINTQ